MVSTINLAREKAPSVLSQIVALDVKGKARVIISKRPYISSLVSGLLKAKYPDRVYTTGIDTENTKYLIIERIA